MPNAPGSPIPVLVRGSFARYRALSGAAGFNSRKGRDGAISGEGPGRLQEGLRVDARCQERLARHEADGNRHVMKNSAFVGGNASSTTAGAGRVQAIQAVITRSAMVVLVNGRDVAYLLVRGARRERRKAGSDAGACCRSLPGKTSNGTARDQEDHGQQ